MSEGDRLSWGGPIAEQLIGKEEKNKEITLFKTWQKTLYLLYFLWIKF